MNTNDTRHTESPDLQEMKSMYQTLRAKVATQTIITPEMIRRTIHNSVTNITRDLKLDSNIGIVMAITWCVIGPLAKMSWTFVILTFIMLAGGVLLNRWSTNPMRDISDCRTSFIQAARMANKSRKRIFYRTWVFGLPIGVIWFLWCLYEMNQSPVIHLREMWDEESGRMVLLSFLVGGLIGSIAWYIELFKRFRQSFSAIESQIEEYTAYTDNDAPVDSDAFTELAPDPGNEDTPDRPGTATPPRP